MFEANLKTKRLYLRAPAICDAAAIAGLLNNWNISSHLALAPYPYGLSDAEAFVDRVSQLKPSAGDIVYAITRERRFLGVISIHQQRRGPNLGYWLGEPYWGRGIMTEAVGAVVHAFFKEPDNCLLTSGFFRGNEASWSIQRRLGFKVTGESRITCVARDAEVANVETMLSRQRFGEFGS